MADGNLVRQSQNGKDSVVFGPSVYDVPLLPYERELIKTVGITEEEYRFFTAEVKRRGKLRPAEYAHIPDIRNDVAITPILINLAISLVLTGVAYLLSPKPKMPSAAKKDGGGTIDTGDVNGASRFTPSRGFETLATLADYAAPIPIIFGRYDSREKVGGMLITPKLVWSRMFSEGTNQRAQLLFVVGEQGEGAGGLKKPDLEGIFLGNNVLDSVFEDFYAFYWKADGSDETKRRIKPSDKVYGTIGGPATGDPSTKTDDTEVFVCPVPGSEKQFAFCHAFSPANNTEFGVFAPIANGTSYRLNYEIISIPKDQTKRAKETQLLSRVKVAGDNNFVREQKEAKKAGAFNGSSKQEDQHGKQGQKGMGRNYSPRMGIVRLIRKNDSNSPYITGNNLTRVVGNVQVDDVVQFIISPESIEDDLYKIDGRGAGVSDINSAVLSEQLAADDAMRLGEQFQIGGCIWKVTSREYARFDPTSGDNQEIELTCIDTALSDRKNIGIVNLNQVIKPNDGYIGDMFVGDDPDASEPGQNVGEAFWPITKTTIALVRNNRPAIATEIGIKSIVFQNLKGLCAFAGLPSVTETNDYDEDNLQVKTGRISAYIARTSVFRVFVRQVGSDSKIFNAIPIYFAIRGQRPVAQYTFIRFQNNNTLGAAELEFKFVQVSGSELRFITKDGSETEVFDMSQPGSTDDTNRTTTTVEVTNIGNMTVTAPGKFIPAQLIRQNNEFIQNPRTITGSIKEKYPQTVVAFENRPEPQAGRCAAGELERIANIGFRGLPQWDDDKVITFPSNERNIGERPFTKDGGKVGAFTWELYGDSDLDPKPVGFSRIFRTTEYHKNNYTKWLVIEWRIRKEELPENHYARGNPNGYDQKTTWVVDKATVISSGPGFSQGKPSWDADDDLGNGIIEVRRGLYRTDVFVADPSYEYPIPQNRQTPLPVTGAQYVADDTKTARSNPFVGYNPGGNMTSSGQRYRITDLQAVDPVHGRAQGYRYEIFGAANDPRTLPLGTTATTVRQLTGLTDSTKRLRIRLTATVKELDIGYQLNETQGWSVPEIKVLLDENGENTTNNIQKDDFFKDVVNISSINPFRTVYDVAGVKYQVTNLKTATTTTAEVTEGDFEFAEQTQYSDISHYRDLVEKSNASQPEHQIVYVNEIQEYPSEQAPFMNDLTLAGLSLKAGRNFSQLDQLRCWLAEGIPVERLHPDKQTDSNILTAYEDSSAIGPSNLLTDLVYYLLTNQMGGAGGLLAMGSDNPYLVDKDDMIKTSKFLYQQKLFFNGPITERTNLRQFISDVAPYFLCNFVVVNGKFSLKPALPVFDNGVINDGTVVISGLFTDGNILEDSYKIEYLGAEERRAFQAIVRYRQETPNKLPEEKAVTVKGTGGGYSDPRVELLPQEQFDLTGFCTSESHAVMVAKYFLSLRKLVTHTISFSTTLDGLSLTAGDYIKVITTSSPYSSTKNGTISATGEITSLTNFANGQYNISYFKSGSEDVQRGTMQVDNKTVSDETFFNSVFAIVDDTVSQNVYVVEQLTFSQEGTVDIVASEHPCFTDNDSQPLQSKLVDAILSKDNFTIF